MDTRTTGLEAQVRQMQLNHRQLGRALGDEQRVFEHCARLRNRFLMRIIGTEPRPLEAYVRCNHQWVEVPAELEPELIMHELTGTENISDISETPFCQVMWELAKLVPPSDGVFTHAMEEGRS